MTNSLVVERCESFEWRGPFAGLTRVDGNSINVIRHETDWSDVVGDKPIKDMRSNNLADLYPSPRAVLASVMGGLEKGSSSATKKAANGPRMQ